MLAAPALLALCLRLFHGAHGGRALDGLMSCVVFACLIGLTTAWGTDLARALLTAAERATRGQATTEPLLAGASDGAANVFGHAAAPAAQALLIGTAALALALAPFMN